MSLIVRRERDPMRQRGALRCEWHDVALPWNGRYRWREFDCWLRVWPGIWLWLAWSRCDGPT
jgi:hypothetical protein